SRLWVVIARREAAKQSPPLRGAPAPWQSPRERRSLRCARDDRIGPAGLAMTEMYSCIPALPSYELVFRRAHDQMHGGAEMLRELRAINRHWRILAVGPERAQQRPSPARFQGRLDEPVEQLGDHIPRRPHPPGVD